MHLLKKNKKISSDHKWEEKLFWTPSVVDQGQSTGGAAAIAAEALIFKDTMQIVFL